MKEPKKKRLNKVEAAQEIDALVKKGMPEAEARAVVLPRTDTYSIKGGVDVVWGVDDTSTLGIITNVSIDKSGENELLHNQQGAVDGVVFYDEKTAVKMTVMAKAAASLPAPGESLTIGSVTGLVMSTTESKEFKGVQKFDVVVNTWTNLVLS